MAYDHKKSLRTLTDEQFSDGTLRLMGLLWVATGRLSTGRESTMLWMSL